MKHVYLIVLTCLLAVVCSCSRYDKEIRFALSVAGDNRTELEKVLKKYEIEGDPEKYEAACFLIRNMPYHFWYEGPQIDSANVFFKIVRNNPQMSASHIQDSIANKLQGFPENIVKYDIMELDSAFICHTIESAFKQRREKPWGRLYDFKTFCEYVLPYRIDDEKPELWQDEYSAYFEKSIEHKLDTVKNLDLIDVLTAIVSDTCFSKPILTSSFPCALPHIGPTLVKYNCGTCRELNDYIIYACRSLGVPATVNFAYTCSRMNVLHSWSSYWDNNGEERVITRFPPKIYRPTDDSLVKYKKTKVFRKTYSVNGKSVEMSKRAKGYIPRKLRFQTYEDVTRLYTDSIITSFSFPDTLLYRKLSSRLPVFLCSSSRFDWVPECLSFFQKKKITFDEIQYGEVQRLCIYVDKKIVPVSDPFIVNADGSLRMITADEDNRESVILYSKFTRNREEKKFQDRLLGGKVEGDYSRDFRNPETICTITSIMNRKQTMIPVDSTSKVKAYPFIRYNAANGTYCDIADLFLYDKDGTCISGEVFGKDPSNIEKYKNVFDGKSTTSYHSSERNGDWVAIRVSSKRPIVKIGVTPRNRDNFIDIGNEYELFYLDKDWKSLGKKIAQSDSLVYSNVPKGSLLLLSNHTHGKQERIFTYENGAQVMR